MFNVTSGTPRQRMIEQIRQEAKYTSFATGKQQLDDQVIRVMGELSREKFVPAMYEKQAYDNGPLPIGHGQTISQPYIVALMTDLLDLKPDNIVLEIGTGSGYQCAVLSRLCAKVYSVERITELARTARACLQEQGFENIEISTGNGYLGWSEHAPYDAIIVTAAAPYIPPALLEQLKPGGKMVIPLGLPYANQELIFIHKDHEQTVHQKKIIDVSFVPLKDES
jgi:protein-L-isoaspartate(D-aspartate) O-methyltransferase